MATNLSQDPFSTAEEYALKAQGYSDLWDNAMAKVYSDLADSLWNYTSDANAMIWTYDNLLNYMSWNENKLQNVAWTLYNDLVNDLNNQRTYVNNMFWPNGELTNEVNKYYDNLWNYLATDAWRQAAIIAAQWQHSWASLWAIRAQQNEAYNQSFQRYVQAKEQQINAKQQIASNLINFMSTLRQEYWNTTNQYIIKMYKRANDLYNNTALSLAQDLDNYNKLRFSNSWSGGSSSQDLYNSLIKLLGGWWEENGDDSKKKTIISNETTNDAKKQEALDQLGQKLDNANNKKWTSTATKISATAVAPWAFPFIWAKELTGNKNK